MAHDIFICHAHADLNTALAACAKLEDAGVRCWIAPRNVDAGPYARQLVHAITEANAVLLIFSDKTNQSEHILRELEIASKHQKVIIPFRIEDVPPNEDLEYFTLRVHWLDALKPPMESRLGELVAFVKRLLAARPVLTDPALHEATPTPVAPDVTPAPHVVEAETTAKQQPGIEARRAALESAQDLLQWLQTSTGVVVAALAVAFIVIVVGFATRPSSRPPFPYRTFAPISAGNPTGFVAIDRTLQNCPTDRALMADFFREPSLWTKLSSNEQIARGFLAMRPPKGHFELNFHDGIFHSDTIICARATASGPDVPPTSIDTTAGVIFWDYVPKNAESDYYLFQVNYRGNFTAFHRSHAGWTLLTGPTHSEAIHTQAGASNVLAVRTSGHNAMLYVNGIQVDTVHGNPPAGGWWGGVLGAIGADEDRNATWGFDAYGVEVPGLSTGGQR